MMTFPKLISLSIQDRNKRLEYYKNILTLRAHSKKWRQTKGYFSPKYLIVDLDIQRACLNLVQFNSFSLLEITKTIRYSLINLVHISLIPFNVLKNSESFLNPRAFNEKTRAIRISFGVSGKTTRFASVPLSFIEKYHEGNTCLEVEILPNGGLSKDAQNLISLSEALYSILIVTTRNLVSVSAVQSLPELHLFLRELFNFPLISMYALSLSLKKNQNIDSVYIVSENFPREDILEQLLGERLIKVNTSLGFRFDRPNLFFENRFFFTCPSHISSNKKNVFVKQNTQIAIKGWEEYYKYSDTVVIVEGMMQKSHDSCLKLYNYLENQLTSKKIKIREHPRRSNMPKPTDTAKTFYICCSSTNYAGEISPIGRSITVDLAINNGANPFVHLGISFFGNKESLVKKLMEIQK